MVRKLDGFYYDKSKWKLGTKNNRYYLIQLSNPETPHYIGLRRNIVAVTQVSEDSIIILEKYEDSYYIRFYKISKKGDIEEISSVSCNSSCQFWTDTIILLDESTVFDLSLDKSIYTYSSVLRYLHNNDLHSICLKRNGNREYLYCTREITSPFGRGDFLQLVIDIETCKPALPIYSTLRNSLIDLTDTFTLENLIKEESKYKKIVDNHMIAISMSAGESVLLSAFDED